MTGAVGRDGTISTPRVHRAAGILTPGDEIQIEKRPPARVGGGVERLLGLLRRRRPHPPEAVGDAVHVRVHADVLAALERHDHHQRGGLASDARQRHEVLECRRHTAAVDGEQPPGRRLHVAGLVAVEAHRVDQPLDLLDRQRGQRARRARPGEQAGRGRQGGGVLRARRQQRGDEHLERVVLLRLGDLLDRRQLHAVDLPGQGPQHPLDQRRLGTTGAGGAAGARPGGRHGREAHGTGVTGGCPASTASTLDTARSAIAVRVSVVALARCGMRSTFSSPSRSGCTTGSFS